MLVGYVDFEDGLGRLSKDLLPVLEQRGLREPFAPLGNG
jgi:FMNH2-dependent dimethyl sulfone monooxygenase